jgi:hypothetical protein
MNYHNLAQKTNYIAGSDKLDLIPFYLTTLNIPGISLGHPELGGRTGSRLNVTADTITYNTLSIEALVDEDFNVYHELMDKIFANVDPEEGTFDNVEFDFWVEVSNNKGNKIFKLELFNCRIETIGDIQLDSQDDSTEYTMPIDVKYDYFKIEKLDCIPTLLDV